MSIIDILHIAYRLGTQTVAPKLPGFQGLKIRIQYFATHPHKPILYPYNLYEGSNVIRLTLSGYKVEYYKTQNCLE